MKVNKREGFLLRSLISIAAAVMLTACGQKNLSMPEENTDVLLPAAKTTASESEASPSVSESTSSSAASAYEEESSAPTETPAVTSSETVSLTSESETFTSTYASTSVLTEGSSVSSSETSKETTVSESVTSVSETETAVVTDCSVPKADPVQAMNVPSSSYDKDFFADDLFIGDSISTGYSLYGFFPEKNVFAKVGLNPSTVLTKTVSTCFGDIGVADMVAYTMPKRAYIMLGSNGIQWLNPDNMVKSTEKLVNLIHETSADTEVVIISVPPVTPEYASTVSEVNVVDIINRYNAALSKFCEENGLLYVNGFSVLKNSEGYFDYAYAEADGMHFKASAYKTLLSKIQSDVEEFEAAEEEESPAETEPEVTEGETSAVTEDIDSKLWEDASKMSDAAKERLLGVKD